MKTHTYGNYRSEGNHLFEKNGDVFIHVFQEAGTTGLNRLVAAYKRHCEQEQYDNDVAEYMGRQL